MSLRGVRNLITFGRRAATSWHTAVPLIPLVLLGELVLCLLIIKVIRYTPIDFKAYMEEVEGPLVHGVYNYSLLRGETGPLVYPGGFVYLYGAIRWLAHDGTDVLPAQLAMAACYVATLGACTACHAIARPRGVPPWALLLVSTSLRLHSIYVLRLFNDGWAMLGFWLAVLAFLRGHWKLGCALYSLGVSVKANVLLSAPGLLLLLLQAKGLAGALSHIALCAAVQLGLGWPFLRADFFAYLRGALGGFGDLQQKWCTAAAAHGCMPSTARAPHVLVPVPVHHCTCAARAHRVLAAPGGLRVQHAHAMRALPSCRSANWKMLPPALFYHRAFPLALLAVHLFCLGMLAARVWTAKQGGLLRALQLAPRRALHPEHVLVTLVGCNCVGVLFARSLHFQFYCWYLHGVPLLLWRCAALPLALKLLTYALLEYAFSYGLDRVEGTSTPASSAALLLAHAIILYALCRAEPPPTYADERPPARPLARSD